VHKAYGRMRWSRLGLVGLVWLFLYVITGSGCSLDPKERLNPLDPENPNTDGDPFHLTLSLVDTVTDSDTVKRIQLNWLNIEHSTLEEYHVYRRIVVSTEPFALIGITERGQTTFTDLGGRSNVRYHYRVIALMAEGTDSVFSESVTSFRFVE
jgi:hypothetical protein